MEKSGVKRLSVKSQPYFINFGHTKKKKNYFADSTFPLKKISDNSITLISLNYD